MSDYQRHTTKKGNMLLNINPPSTVYSPVGLDYIRSDSPNKKVQMSPTTNIYDNPQTNSHVQVGQNPHLINLNPTHNSWQQRQLPPQQPPNSYLFTPVGQPVRPNTLTGERKISVSNYNERPFADSSSNSPAKPIQKVDRKKNDSRRKNTFEEDATICCFPAYWLILLMVGVVVGAFVLILTKENLPLIPQKSANSASAAPPASASSTTSTQSTPSSSPSPSSSVSVSPTSTPTSTSTSPSFQYILPPPSHILMKSSLQQHNDHDHHSLRHSLNRI